MLARRRRAMAVGATPEDRVFSEVKRLCYAGLDEATLLRQVAESLRRAVPFEGYCAHAVDPLSRLIANLVPDERAGEKEARHFLEHLYFADDFNDYNSMTKSRRPVALLSEATDGRLERSLRYREFMEPLGYDHELRSVFTAGKELWGAVDVRRERGRPDFEPREVRLFRRVAPHLGAGLKAAVLRSQAPAGKGGDGTPGVLVLDNRGRVSHYTAAAERWLEELEDPDSRWHEGRGPSAWREGKGLPAAMWTVVSTLRRALKPETERDKATIPRVCVRARSGRWLTFQASLSEPHANGSSETVIVIEPPGPKEMLWLNTASYGLTARERAVVDLVMRGFTTAQISATLFISKYTVQEHLCSAFDKVGVRDRQALVKRLFFDNIYPTLLGDFE
jgi:DNA-binding CsgD family transcriptional regulator